MTTSLKIAWSLAVVAAVTAVTYGVARLEYHAWVVGGLCAAAGMLVAVILRLTADMVMGTRTEKP